MGARKSCNVCHFYPRSPCGERPAFDVLAVSALQISIHALLAESDGKTNKLAGQDYNFYPRSPCGERLNKRCQCSGHNGISIHALLAESDVNKIPYQRQIYQFLSTLSLRRATIKLNRTTRRITFLSTLSLRRATPISVFIDYAARFLSTLSLRRATNSTNTNLGRHRDFYPRSPCGERQMYALILANAVLFLSTLSLRRATAKVHKTVGHFCAYETNFMEIASSC